LSAFTLVEGDVTLRSGGIETAASDGIPLLVGTRGYIGVGFDGTNTRFIRVDTLGRSVIVGPDAPGASATGNPVVAAGVDIGGFVRQIFTDSSGRQRIVGAADNAAPVTGAPVLVGGSDGTNVYRLLTDSAGRLQVVATGSSGGTSSTYGAVFPASGTASGFFDGTNMQGARVFDLDTGGGTEWDIGVSLRLPGAGGSVVGGTLSDPIRIDPTGTTAQPVNTLQLPAALVGGRLDANVGAWLGSTAPTVGQKTSANSVPTVLASDQPALPLNVVGTHANAWNAVAVAANGTSAAIDCRYVPHISVFGNTSGNTTITIQESQDNTNFYDTETLAVGGGGGNFGIKVTSGARYIRLKSSQAKTITATIAGKG